MKVRLQKFLADAGIASRRASEELIVRGKVCLNGETVRELGTKVDPATDEVLVDGERVKAKRKIYIALNKPPGYICSRADPLRRKTVGQLIPEEWRHLYPVGRLDLDSEGLLFLTNDGNFALHLTHPRYSITKKYQVQVRGRPQAEMLKRMTDGIYHQDELLRADKVRLLKADHSRSLVEVQLSEGKNREVRRLFESQGLTVERLQRIQIGPIKLGQLPLRKWRVLTPSEVRALAKLV